jgi:hypothetical protein
MSAPFPLPLMFTSWGFRNSGDNWNNGSELADRCRRSNIKTVCVQTGRDEQGRDYTTADDVAPLRAAGLRVVVWGIGLAAHDARAELARLGASEADWMPQIEGPGQRDAVLAAAQDGLHPQAIVTNYSGGGDTPGEADTLRAIGVRMCLVECYADDGPPHNDITHKVYGTGQNYGWREDELYALMGTYRGEMPDSYNGSDQVGPNWGCYLAEPMSTPQWDAFGQLALQPPPTPEPEPPDPEPQPPTPEGDVNEPVTDKDARATVRFASHAWEQNQGDTYQRRARLVASRRICDEGNTDAIWQSIRDEIIDILDRAGVPQ